MVVSSTGYYYSDASSSNPNIQTHVVNQNQNQLQSFESNQAEMYNLATSMEMIGFPPKNNLQQQQQQLQQSETNSVLWKGFSSGKPNPSSSMTVDEYDHFNKTDFRGSTTGLSDTTSSENLMVAPDRSTAWHNHNRLVVTTTDSSLRSCVFPCEGNERPSQGLSLSLSSTNPSTIGLQSFELRQQDHDIKFMPPSTSRDIGFFGKSMNNIQQQHQHMVLQDGFLGKAADLHNDLGHFQIRNSKYLGPAQQLLNEFCNLGTKQTHDPLKTKPHKSTTQWQDENAASGSSSKKLSLSTLELLELQKRKTKLLSMLEEVDRRYRHYRDQMKAVVSSFEAVAGNGAAMVYSALASKAMSRHFRCLRDGIVDQIKANKKAMGEKDAAAPGTTRGETPRLRLLDQTLRQHRAFQQMSMMESHPWRPQRGLPERAVSVLRAWLFEHFLHPYPSDVDKHILARQTGLSRSQVSNWFINARVRLWKPMVEEMYVEETKEQDSNMASSSDNHGLITAMVDNCGSKQSPHSTHPDHEDQKLKLSDHQLVRIDSECLSSIINNQEKNDTTKNSSKSPHNLHHHHFGSATGTFGAMELDFSSYSHRAYANNENEHHNFGGGGSTLTLGLQQHNGGGNNGVSLAFSPASQNSLFFNRDHIEDCQPVHQYSLLDTEGQNLPYRNLMGAQLLHDLAG